MKTNKDKPSRKHHYLPSHYLKGFTNDKGNFFVFDKKTNKIFKSSPDNIFFENELNTVILPKGDKSVFIEDQYTQIENICWPSIDKIRKSDSKKIIDFSDKEFLFMFLVFLYWRLPDNISKVEKLSETAFTEENPASYLLLKNKNGEKIPSKVIEGIRGSSAFKKSFRLVLPFVPFLKDKSWGDKIQNWKFFYTENSKPFYVVGDNPIIIKNNNDDPANLLDEFIFPISGNILLINNIPSVTTNLPPDFIIQYNTAMIEKANRFVVCSDEITLKALVTYYNQYIIYGKNDTIIDEMFTFLKTNNDI